LNKWFGRFIILVEVVEKELMNNLISGEQFGSIIKAIDIVNT
jgi:hypothetical protein